MSPQPERRYSISEVSDLLDVPAHVLRQWEDRFIPLRPKRDRANRRYYLQADIDIARRIKQLMRHEKMTAKGAARVLAQELHGEGRPKTNQEARELADAIQREIRTLLDLMDQTDQTVRDIRNQL